MVLHACNPSYLGSWDEEDLGSRLTWANGSQDPTSKLTREKWTGDVTQAIVCLLNKCKALSSNPRPTIYIKVCCLELISKFHMGIKRSTKCYSCFSFLYALFFKNSNEFPILYSYWHISWCVKCSCFTLVSSTLTLPYIHPHLFKRWLSTCRSPQVTYHFLLASWFFTPCHSESE
jgi:hypothetical protein